MTDQTLADLADRIEHRLKLAERHGPLNEGREVYIQAKDLPAILSALREREVMREALRKAEQFIVNGVDLGFIRLPETADDPAHLTLPAIRAALQGGGE